MGVSYREVRVEVLRMDEIIKKKLYGGRIRMSIKEIENERKNKVFWKIGKS